MSDLPYLAGYPPALLEHVRALVAGNRLGAWLTERYPGRHDVQTDRALYQYLAELRQRYLKNAAPLAKVRYDNRQHPVHGTLGTNTFVSRVQGGKLKSKNEIRIATLFREAPPEFLKMIAVHELSHLKEKEHNKAFYQLCCHMEPDYHQLEFDLRLWLTERELNPIAGG
ncbi:M48 family metallopeptidase [Pseudogulbenkiania sp. MAI-1]|uniref:M48 metallopeptidase family protein n=1 Tax=Pseudogulbenkiania sp. MAI-1 TaxID=990370 RepID=UPI00045E59DA|nr:M48 family metallopeptidase [Pseudogulbenkiania sp. MAI-1]